MKQLEIYLARSGYIREQALRYIEMNMARFHRVDSNPRDIPEYLFVAYCNNIIVGTLGVECAENGHFSFEHLYHLPKDIVIDSLVSVFYVRWLATLSGVGASLLRVVGCYLLEQGFTTALCIMKSDILNYVDGDHGIWHEIQNAQLVPNNVPQEYRNYFLSEPLPKLYSVHLHEYNALPTLQQFMIIKHLQRSL